MVKIKVSVIFLNHQVGEIFDQFHHNFQRRGYLKHSCEMQTKDTHALFNFIGVHCNVNKLDIPEGIVVHVAPYNGSMGGSFEVYAEVCMHTDFWNVALKYVGFMKVSCIVYVKIQLYIGFMKVSCTVYVRYSYILTL